MEQPWVLVLLPLAGTVLGGAITVVGQWLGVRGQRKTSEQADIRAARREVALAERAAISEILVLATSDLAAVREEWDPVHRDGVNSELLEASERAHAELTNRHVAAAGRLGLILDDAVYDHANKVYTAWLNYFSHLMDGISNETGQELPAKVTGDAMSALTDLSRAARKRLIELDQEIRSPYQSPNRLFRRSPTRSVARSPRR